MGGLSYLACGLTSITKVEDYSKLIRGDHIAVSGRRMFERYYHHGIYLGLGRVADFGGDGKTDTKPRTVSIQGFTDNGKRSLVRINYLKGRCLSPEEAARNAEEFVEKPDGWGPYHILENNCEHFATRCKTGTATSEQAQALKRAMANPYYAMLYALVLASQESKPASWSSIQ